MRGSNVRAFDDFTNKVKGFSQVLRDQDLSGTLFSSFQKPVQYCSMKDQGFNHQLLIFDLMRFLGRGATANGPEEAHCYAKLSAIFYRCQPYSFR